MPVTILALSCEVPEVPGLGPGSPSQEMYQAGCATQKLRKESVGIGWGGCSPISSYSECRAPSAHSCVPHGGLHPTGTGGLCSGPPHPWDWAAGMLWQCWSSGLAAASGQALRQL